MVLTLETEQEIDSTRMGNKFRFINNSELDEVINCSSRVMLCNTVHRIGLYALRNIDVGEELFFNYGYPADITKYFWEKDDPRPAAVGNNGRVVRKASAAAGKGKGKRGTPLGRAAGDIMKKPPAPVTKQVGRVKAKGRSGRVRSMSLVDESVVGSGSVRSSVRTREGSAVSGRLRVPRASALEGSVRSRAILNRFWIGDCESYEFEEVEADEDEDVAAGAEDDDVFNGPQTEEEGESGTSVESEFEADKRDVGRRTSTRAGLKRRRS